MHVAASLPGSGPRPACRHVLQIATHIVDATVDARLLEALLECSPEFRLRANALGVGKRPRHVSLIHVVGLDLVALSLDDAGGDGTRRSGPSPRGTRPSRLGSRWRPDRPWRRSRAAAGDEPVEDARSLLGSRTRTRTPRSRAGRSSGSVWSQCTTSMRRQMPLSVPSIVGSRCPTCAGSRSSELSKKPLNSVRAGIASPPVRRLMRSSWTGTSALSSVTRTRRLPYRRTMSGEAAPAARFRSADEGFARQADGEARAEQAAEHLEEHALAVGAEPVVEHHPLDGIAGARPRRTAARVPLVGNRAASRRERLPSAARPHPDRRRSARRR